MPALADLPVLVPLLSFVLVAIASKQIGKLFSKWGLPYITGYLLTGMLAGPFLLGMMASGSTEELRFIDELSLAVIAFVAGSELYLKELRSRLRSILLNTTGIVVAALILIGLAVFLVSGFVSFAADFDIERRIAMALLGATVLLALSPASTIAVIQEVRAKGPFSKTVLSITVVMDVVIIVLFAVSTAFAGTLIEGTAVGGTFVLLLVVDVLLAVLIGVVLGLLLSFILGTRLPELVKTGLILGVGMALFAASFWVDELKLGIHLEPLLSAMIAGFWVTNFTRFRDEFEEILHDVSPFVYVAFFTLTGVALKLDILLATIGVAALLFLVRIASIFVGSYIGGTLAGEPQQFRRLAWAGLITQAGIALGLAREVAVEFPNTLGDAFATMIIAVVVLNEIFGPMLLKFALRRSGEAHEPGTHAPDEERNAVILGVEGQSVALARQLLANNWQVTLADTDSERVAYAGNGNGDLRAHYITDVNDDCMAELLSSSTDALVAMLENDADNLHACEIALERYGIKRLVARPNDLSHAGQYDELGVQTVDTASAMVNLLDQFVRSPQSASLLLHKDPQYDIVQVTVTDKDVDGVLLRDLRLPSDVLVLEITRGAQTIVPNGHTAIRRQDDVTLVGRPESLKQVSLRLGF